MIIILTYYSDGSAPPELLFHPLGGPQASNVAYDMARLVGGGKSVQVWEVETLEDLPVQIYPQLTDEEA